MRLGRRAELPRPRRERRAGTQAPGGRPPGPEGVYRLTALNPNSSYHLSIRVDYPNELDRARAREEGRDRPGGDIYVHGKAVSIGCLAMGDEAVEQLFVLVADTGLGQSRIVIAPNRSVGPAPPEPAWVGGLYRTIAREIERVKGGLP